MAAHRLLALLIATVLVAGCAGGKGTDEPAPSSPSSTVNVGGNLTEPGAIEGVVKDEELQPLSGITIALRELGASAKTDDNGSFGFTAVPAGDHTLDAAALGFEAHAKKVTVLAGETAQLEIVLNRIVVVESYNETIILTGKITCGAVAVPWCGATQDVDAPSPTNDRYAWGFEVPEVFPAYEIYEMVWVSTVPGTGEKLALLYVTTDAEDPLGIHTIFSSEAASPVRGEASQSALMSAHAAYPDSALSLGVYPAIDGAVVDQSFTIYKTTFWGDEPAEGWTYLSQVEG